MENKNTFVYNYSAEQQEEIKQIREKYAPKEESKMDQLRRLDASVTKLGSIVALAVGIICTLVLGVGMCCCLVWNIFVPGVIIGVIGIVGVSLAYPIYTHITEKQREKLAPEIIRLTDELMK